MNSLDPRSFLEPVVPTKEQLAASMAEIEKHLEDWNRRYRNMSGAKPPDAVDGNPESEIQTNLISDDSKQPEQPSPMPEKENRLDVDASQAQVQSVASTPEAAKGPETPTPKRTAKRSKLPPSQTPSPPSLKKKKTGEAIPRKEQTPKRSQRLAAKKPSHEFQATPTKKKQTEREKKTQVGSGKKQKKMSEAVGSGRDCFFPHVFFHLASNPILAPYLCSIFFHCDMFFVRWNWSLGVADWFGRGFG